MLIYKVLRFKCPHPDKERFPTYKYYDVIAASTDRDVLVVPEDCRLLCTKDEGSYGTVYFKSHSVIDDKDQRWLIQQGETK